MIKTLILIHGKKGTGKTTACNYIVNNINRSCIVYPLATLLKRVVASINNIDVNKLENQEFKQSDSGYKVYDYGRYRSLTYRQLLLHIARKLRFDNDKIFIDDTINHLIQSNCNIGIVPDVRELQEVKFLKRFAEYNSIKLIFIKIIRPTEYDLVSADKTETDLDNYKDFDYIINNTGDDINQLYFTLISILNQNQLLKEKPFTEQNLF